jgi:hypothetical protein
MLCKSRYIQHCCFHTGIVWKERKIRMAVICLGKKVKVKFTLKPAVWHRGGIELLVYSFFNFDVQRGVCLTPRLDRFTPRKWNGTHCIGSWVGLGDSLERWGKLSPTGIRSPDRTDRGESLFRLRSGVGLTIKLKWILWKWVLGIWTLFICSKIRSSVESLWLNLWSLTLISAHLTRKVVFTVIYLLVTWRAHANRGDVCLYLLSEWFGAVISLSSECCAILCVYSDWGFSYTHWGFSVLFSSV